MIRILDLFCKQGGASAGYAAAGFDVFGVDIEPQPRYPYPFFRGDVLEYLRQHMVEIRRYFDAVHASPPCQRYSGAQRIRGREHPDLIGPVREVLVSLGLPFVIENVEGARSELRSPSLLCGTQFGLRTYRHRLFETGGGFRLDQPPHPVHRAPLAKMGRPPEPYEFIQAVGNFSGVDQVRRDYGVGWMNRDGIRECVPPAYAEFAGLQLSRILS